MSFLRNCLTVACLVPLAVTGYAQSINNVVVDANPGDESETAITVDPKNPNHLMATWNEYGTGSTAKPGWAFSTDGGKTWSPADDGLTDNSVGCLLVSDSDLVAGTWGTSVWRWPLSQLLTAVRPIVNQVPIAFNLAQNYPDPFNPTTVIEYTIPKDYHVTLKIYEVLGQEVKTLVNQDQRVGRYSVNFNGSRLASGVYFYRLVAGNHVITKKMLMIK